MIAARTRIAALVVVIFALTSILWGSTAAHAATNLSISGTVFLGDGNTTATAADVEVEYTLVNTAHNPADFVPVGADGTWTITGLDSGSYLIYYHYIGADGYASKYQSQESVIIYPFAEQATVLGDADLTGLQELLEKTSTVSGHVTLGSGSVSAGAGDVTVTASAYAGQNGADAAYTTLPSIDTDSSGNYTISGLLPGSHWRLLFVSHVAGVQSVYYGQVLDDDGMDFSVGGGLPVTKDQTLPNYMSIAGHVYLGSTATPAGAGAVTLQLRVYNDNVLNTNVISSTVTVAGGGYNFTGLDNHKYQVTAVAPAGYTNSTPVDFTATTTTGDFTLAPVVAPTYALTGHVDVGVSGSSAKAGEIYVGLFLASDEENLLAVTSTDASGNYSFPGLAAGNYVVVASSYNHNDQHGWPYYGPVTAVGASGTVAPTALLPISIAGHVLSPTSVPLSGIQVTAIEYDDTNAATATRTFATTTDANGYYRFPELSYGVFPDTADSYLVLAHDATGQYASLVYDNVSPYYQPDFITVAQGTYGTTHTADFDMPLANHIAGTVTGVSSADLAAGDVTIEVQVLDYSTSDDGEWFNTGDIWPVAADGSYNVGDLPDDAYRLVFSYDGPRGTASTTSPEFDVSGGQTVSYSPAIVFPQIQGDTSYVKALYQDFLGRTPNASEIGFWTDALSIGLPRTSIASGFVTSDEYRLIRIDDAYQSVLGRASDAQGRQWWLAAVKAGSLQIDDVAEHFYSSQEYVDAHQDNGESNVTRNWIHQLYTDLLHRAPDASGLDFWEAATVANGRQSVVDGFWNSQETAGARVSAMYASYLGRTPDPDGLVFWTHVDLTLGDSVTRSSITASDEYYNLASTRFPAPSNNAV